MRQVHVNTSMSLLSSYYLILSTYLLHNSLSLSFILKPSLIFLILHSRLSQFSIAVVHYLLSSSQIILPFPLGVRELIVTFFRSNEHEHSLGALGQRGLLLESMGSSAAGGIGDPRRANSRCGGRAPFIWHLPMFVGVSRRYHQFQSISIT